VALRGTVHARHLDDGLCIRPSNRTGSTTMLVALRRSSSRCARIAGGSEQQKRLFVGAHWPTRPSPIFEGLGGAARGKTLAGAQAAACSTPAARARRRERRVLPSTSERARRRMPAHPLHRAVPQPRRERLSSSSAGPARCSSGGSLSGLLITRYVCSFELGDRRPGHRRDDCGDTPFATRVRPRADRTHLRGEVSRRAG